MVVSGRLLLALLGLAMNGECMDNVVNDLGHAVATFAGATATGPRMMENILGEEWGEPSVTPGAAVHKVLLPGRA